MIIDKKYYRILVVDDERDVATVIKKGLENEGSFEVDTFHDPVQALNHFKAGTYDLLLLDIRMPKMNGFELYRQLRKIDEKARICFITAFEIYYDEFKRVFPKVSVNCFVRKPIRIDELARTIKQELELKEQIDFGKSEHGDAKASQLLSPDLKHDRLTR